VKRVTYLLHCNNNLIIENDMLITHTRFFCYISMYEYTMYRELNLSALKVQIRGIASLLSSFLTHNQGTVSRYPFTQDAHIIMVLFFMSLATVRKPFKNMLGFLCAFFRSKGYF